MNASRAANLRHADLRRDDPYAWLLARLDRVRRRLKFVVWARSLAQAAVAFLIAAPALLLLDNWLHFGVALRALAALGIVAASAGAFAAAARIAMQRWSPERMAAIVEAHFPALENRLINAVQLGRPGVCDAQDPAFPLVLAVMDEAAFEIDARRIADAVDLRGLRRGIAAGAVLAALASAYALLAPDYFANAALRLLHPLAPDLVPITRVMMSVQPGDATVDKGGALTILAKPAGRAMPVEARLEIRGGQKANLRMSVDGSQFACALDGLQSDFKYRVRAGDFISPWHVVRVVEKPRIERMAVHYDYPAYTRLPPATLDPSDGNVTALAGTRATLLAWTDKAFKPGEGASAKAALGSGDDIAAQPIGAEEAVKFGIRELGIKGPPLAVAMTLERDDTYAWKLADAQGLDNAPALTRTIRALDDAPPRVAIEQPRGEVELAPGAELKMLYAASDDYGLAEAVVTLESAAGSRELFKLKIDPPRKALNEGYVLKTDGMKAGDAFALRVAVRDFDPARHDAVLSAPLNVRIVAPPGPAEMSRAALKQFLADLARLIAKQKALRSDLDRWRVGLAAADENKSQAATLAGALAREAQGVLGGQSALRVEAVQSADAAPGDAWAKQRGQLRAVAENEMKDAVATLKALAAATQARRERSLEARALQSAVIEKLTALLGGLRAEAEAAGLKAAPLEEDSVTSAGTARKPNPQGMYRASLDFLEDSRGLVRTLQEVEATHSADLASTMTQRLGEMAQTEEKWAEYFKDAAEWMRQPAMVGPTESGLRDELIEVHSEIHELPEALRKPNVTINVPIAENGVELAEKLTHHFEKWLAEQPDNIKWTLEDAPKPYAVPLAELPDELEDQIGDLIDEEQKMTQDIEDKSSNWADSLDAGVGWAVADGPMSNYSAKGITGNLLPNNTDIAGRSGEGRNGRSLGEMVESVATGKGGRDSQTRMTSDAMGKGAVEDLSAEQTGGATGGGKIAGTAGAGLVSPNAPQQPKLILKLAQRQAAIRMKAVSLNAALLRMNLPGAHLQSSIDAMTRIEQSLNGGRYDALRDLGAVALSDLDSQRAIAREQFRLRRESGDGGDKLRHESFQGASEQFPDAYRTLISAYYEALAREREIP